MFDQVVSPDERYLSVVQVLAIFAPNLSFFWEGIHARKY